MSRPTLLIMEDDAEMAEVLSRQLGKKFDVVTCSGKSTAVPATKKAIAETRPDAVLLDLIVNGEGGLDVYKYVKGLSGKKPLIAFYTGCHYESDEFQAATATGCRVYEKDKARLSGIGEDLLNALAASST